MTLVIGRGALAGIARAAEAAYPEECCGLLLGRREGGRFVVARVVATANVAEGDRRRRFEVDPRALVAAHRGSRDSGETVIGHYHSHPEGAALPSDEDRARAFDAGQLWLIVPVSAAGAGAPRAWLLHGDSDVAEEIAIEAMAQGAP